MDVNRNITTALKVFVAGIAFLCVYLLLTGSAWSAELDKYEPLTVGFCEDVNNLPCVKMVLKDTKIFYAVFSMDGKLIAITRVKPDGSEETIFGKLPPKKGEHEL